MKKTDEIKVIKTNNLDMFKRLEGNRDVKCVGKIVESINKVGYIPNPICVNEKYEVIDGQNRLEACRRLDLPVYYYIVEGLTIDEARSLNLGRSNWKPIDYVKSYAESGNKSYQMLLDLLLENENYSLQELFGIAKGLIVSNGWSSKYVEKGDFVMSEKEYKTARETIETMKPLQRAIKDIAGSRRTIVTGIAWCLRVVGCDKRRLIDVIMKKYPEIRPVVQTEYFLYDITKLYNNNLKKTEKRIDFDVIWRNEV